MGEFAKKWMAGIGAALVIVVIAAIAIGKMEHKSAAAPSTAGVKASAAASPNAATPAEMPAAESAREPAPAAPGKPSGVSTAAQKSAVKTSWRRVETQPQVPPSSTVAQSDGASAPSQNSSQTQVAQVQVPPAAPDVATPPVQRAQVESQPAALPVSRPDGLMTTGNVSVNGTFIKDGTLIYPNEQLVTPGQNGALVTAKGNAIVLGANSQFKAESTGSIQLDAGAGNVSTKTGMTTKLKDWRVQPVHPDAATQYEVVYESDGVYVYARVDDVDVINDICRRSIRVTQGKAVRIPSLQGCGVAWLNEGTRTWPYKVAAGTAVGAGGGVLLWIATHQERSNLSPP